MHRGRKTVNSAVPMSRHAESWWHQGPWSWVRELAAVAVAIVYATPTDAGEFATGKNRNDLSPNYFGPASAGPFF